MKLGRPAARNLLAALSLQALQITLAGCDRPPSADGLPEWKPGDHDEELSGGGGGSASAGQQAIPAPPKSAGKGGEGGAPSAGQVSAVDIAWTQACATCHGIGGHGDGPSGPTVNAPDLTRPDLQDKYSDDEIAGIIANGKNKMPKFDFSDPVVKGLVAKVRSLRGR
jgi:mono/diheme cytochrome c family protein